MCLLKIGGEKHANPLCVLPRNTAAGLSCLSCFLSLPQVDLWKQMVKNGQEAQELLFSPCDLKDVLL
jgi:hypothetical protein